jgi:phosphonate transport system substrate-binding protein
MKHHEAPIPRSSAERDEENPPTPGAGFESPQRAGNTLASPTRRRLLFAPPLLAAMPNSFAAVARAAGRPLTFGVFPRLNYPRERFMPMATYLGERIGREVQLVTAKNFEAFWAGVVERRYDIAHYNQYHYIRSARAYRVVAHIEELDKSTITGVVFVRRASGITSLAQLRGRTVIFGGGEDAMMSYITIRHQLLKAGLKKDDFKSLFAVNPANALLALGRGMADAAGAGDGVPALRAVREAIDVSELTALSESLPLLQLPIAVRRDMPDRLGAAIQSALLDLNKSERGRKVLASALMTGMGKAEDKDYDPHRRMAREVFESDGTPGRALAEGEEPGDHSGAPSSGAHIEAPK